jgi:hypothetical protein
MAIQDVLPYLQAVGAALGLVKQAKELLPAGPAKAQIEEKIAQAEEKSRAAEADLAKAMGYALCKAHWPPVIMLSVGYHDKRQVECFQCPECKAKSPPDSYFKRLDEEDEMVQRYNRGDRI